MMSGVEIFRGIRYARSERLGQPMLVPWDGVRHADRGPICPQRPSRLETVQGPIAPMTMDEHCQYLSVFTPGTTGNRPVMVFLHGGGFVTGGGELPWYDGDKLAGEQDVVVVSVTHRLGAFGYFQYPGATDPSPGMADQVTALRWIGDHIAQFGGDPANVTVFGQSAGGFSIVAMLAWGHGGTLFHRAITHSGANGVERTRAEGERISALFREELGHDPLTADIENILTAQRTVAARFNQLVLWAPVFPDEPGGPAVDLIAGWCRDDALPFVLLQHHVSPAPGTETTYADETREMNTLFEGGSRSLASEINAAGKRGRLFRFDWQSPGTGLGACHCIDLPFLLGCEEAWRAAPVTAGAAWTDIEAHGRNMRQLWADFARGDLGDAEWPVDTVRILP